MVNRLMWLLVTRQDRAKTQHSHLHRKMWYWYQVEEDRRQGDTETTSLQPMALILCAEKGL